MILCSTKYIEKLSVANTYNVFLFIWQAEHSIESFKSQLFVVTQSSSTSSSSTTVTHHVCAYVCVIELAARRLSSSFSCAFLFSLEGFLQIKNGNRKQRMRLNQFFTRHSLRACFCVFCVHVCLMLDDDENDGELPFS